MAKSVPSPIVARLPGLGAPLYYNGLDNIRVDNGQIGTLFDYYVDSLGGNDFNDGRTASSPFATIAAAIAAVGSATNKTVGLKYGSVFRGERIAFGGVGTIVGAYGDPTLGKPQILGSTAIAIGSTWTNVSGTIYSKALAYTPINVFWVTPAGTITKLYPGTAGALTANQWAVTGGNLQVNIGKDPTTETVEVPNNISSPASNDLAIGLIPGAANQGYRNLVIRYWPGSGVTARMANFKVIGCSVGYNGNDGIDTESGAQDFLISRTTMEWNGALRAPGSGGAGDGFSAHNTSRGIIEYCRFLYNDRSGVGNQADTFIITRYCYFEGNWGDWKIYAADEGNPTGAHTLLYSVVRRTRSDESVIQVDGPSLAALTITVHNNTFATIASVTGGVALRFATGAVSIKNNIVGPNFASGIGAYYPGSGFGDAVVTSDYNSFGCTAKYQGGFGPGQNGYGSAGANDLLSDPQIIDLTNGNYGIKSTSPAKSTGAALGYAVDYYGNAVPTTPCRGAVERLLAA